MHEAATPGGDTATINRYAAADACARTTPTEACVKQHLGAVAETGEEGARLLPPQLFQACRYFSPRLFQACRHVSPRPPFGNTGGTPPQNSLLCSLPFGALFIQADSPACGSEYRASDRGLCPEKFVISRNKLCCKKHCPKVGSAFCLCAAQRPRQNTLVEKLLWRLREQTLAALT